MKLFKADCGVWMDEETGYSLARLLVESMMRSARLDASDFRRRDPIIMDCVLVLDEGIRQIEEVTQEKERKRKKTSKFPITIEYYKSSGKWYTSQTVVMEVRGLSGDNEQPYLPDVVSKVRGWRDNGGPGALPGLSGEGWDGPIRVICGDGVPCLIMPKQ